MRATDILVTALFVTHGTILPILGHGGGGGGVRPNPGGHEGGGFGGGFGGRPEPGGHEGGGPPRPPGGGPHNGGQGGGGPLFPPGLGHGGGGPPRPLGGGPHNGGQGGNHGGNDGGGNWICARGGELLNCGDIQGGGIAPLPIQCDALADIIFILDASSSIGIANYKKVLSFATNLAASFNTGPEDVRFGLIAFSDNAKKEFDLKDTTSDRLAVYRAILKTPYYTGTTATDKALSLVITSKMFDSLAGGRSNAPDIVIVVTDGQSGNPSATATAAEKLRKAGTTIFAIGIGSSVNQRELLSVAGNYGNVFTSIDFDVLENILYQLVQRTCVATGGIEGPVAVEPTVPAKPPACIAIVDLIYVLDSSGSIGAANYKKQLQFTSDLASNFKIGVKDVLVGCIIFSHVAQKWFDLKDNPTYAALNRALLNAPYLNYTTHTDEALQLIFDERMFAASAGARSNANQFVIVVTDGQSDKPDQTKAVAERLKANGVTIISVGIGQAQYVELLNIASGSKNVFKIDNFDALKQIESAVIDRACSGKSG